MQDDTKKRIAENNARVLMRMINPNDTLMNCEVDALWWQPRHVDHEKIKRMKREKIDNVVEIKNKHD